MDYQKAKELRGKSFSERLTENLLSGRGIGESFTKTLSEKSKARTMGIKEAFDPLNIAKKLTGGSRLGPALLGKMMGRSKTDLEYFAGDPKKRKMSSMATTGLDAESLQASTESLGRIYELLKQDRQNKVEQQNRKKSFEESLEEQEEQRNQELIKVLTARRKKTPKEKRKEEVKQKETERKTKADNKKTENKENVEQKKADAKKEPEAKKTEGEKKQTVEKVKKEEVKQTADKQKTEAKQKKVEEAPKAAPAPKPAEVKPPTVTKVPPVVISGTKGLVLGALVAAGYSKQAQANVMANVEKESNFKPRSEELEKYSAKTLYKLYGPPGADGGQPADGKNKVRFQSLQEAQAVVDKGPVAVGDLIYGGRMGNNAAGDGYKYRGRGFIQITGKENYDKVGKLIGVDLVNNPDLANQPEVAAKIIPAFFKLRLKKPEDLENIDAVNKAVGSASEQSREQRKKLALAYASELNTGTQIDRASTENRELKKETSVDKPAVIVNNSTTTVQKQASSTNVAPVNDKPAYMKKVQGQ